MITRPCNASVCRWVPLATASTSRESERGVGHLETDLSGDTAAPSHTG